MDFYQTLTNGLAQGKPFASICLNAKLKPVAGAAVLAQHPEPAERGGPCPAQSIQATRLRHAGRQGQPLPADGRWRVHCLCEAEAAAGRGEDERGTCRHLPTPSARAGKPRPLTSGSARRRIGACATHRSPGHNRRRPWVRACLRRSRSRSNGLERRALPGRAHPVRLAFGRAGHSGASQPARAAFPG